MINILSRLLTFARALVLPLLRSGRQEILLLVIGLVVLVFIYLFIKLMDEVKEGDTQNFDESVLLSLRRADDPAIPIGPHWLREAGLDATALGSPLVIILVVTAVVGFMLLERQYRVMWLTLFSTSSGSLLAVLLKYAIVRDRPIVVPRLREVATPSFPSGHAMLSAVVYLTLGILLREVAPRRLTKLYCVLWAMFLTGLVGASRIYLGVHYPTDVLAGWMAGLAWALTCALIAQCFKAKNGISVGKDRATA